MRLTGGAGNVWPGATWRPLQCGGGHSRPEAPGFKECFERVGSLTSETLKGRAPRPSYLQRPVRIRGGSFTKVCVPSACHNWYEYIKKEVAHSYLVALQSARLHLLP